MRDVIVDRTLSAASAGGASLAGIGGLTANEVAAFGGLAIAAASFILNWFYRHKTYQHQKSIAEQNAGPSGGS